MILFFLIPLNSHFQSAKNIQHDLDAVKLENMLKAILAFDFCFLLRVQNFNFGEKVNCRNLPLTQNFFLVFSEKPELLSFVHKFLQNNAGTYNVYQKSY